MSDPKTYLYHLAEHGSHSSRSSLHGLGCGGGSEPRKDPTEAEMLSITIGIVIEKLWDGDILKRWVEEESGRRHAEARSDLAPVFDAALEHQERTIDLVERQPRFKSALHLLNYEMKRRLEAEKVLLNRREDV